MNLNSDAAGWKVAIFFAGLVCAGLIFWFGGGQSMATLVSSTSAALTQLERQQNSQGEVIQTISNTMDTLRESIDLQNQRLTFDEKNHELR